MDSCPSPFLPHVGTVFVCSLGDTTKAEMNSYYLAALAPSATTHPSPPSGGIGDPGVRSRGTKAIATVNLQIEVPELHPKKVPEWSQVSNMLTSGQSAHS